MTRGNVLSRIIPLLRSKFEFASVACIAALGAGLVLLRQAGHGPRIGWDAVNYITVARNLLAGMALSICWVALW